MNTMAKKTDLKKLNLENFLKRYGLLFILVLIIIILTIVKPTFATIPNVLNVLRQVSINGLLALGMTFVILTGGIDLSVGSLVGISGILAAVVAQDHSLSALIPAIVGIVVAMTFGLANGLFISIVRVPAFITTLGMLSIARGICYFITGGAPVPKLSPQFLNIGGGDVLGIPIPIIILAVACLLCMFVLYSTKFGRYIYALGGNEEAAITSGLKVKSIKTAVYVIMGFFAGLTGVVLTARVTSGLALSGQNYELDAIAAVVIGGTSLNGGEGRLWGTILGFLLMGVINNGLDLLNVSSYFQLLIKGLIIILAVALDVQTKRRGK